MTFTYREGLGRPLTWQEMDDNFKAVDEAGQQASQDSQNAANSASSASQSAQSASDSRDVVQLLRDQTQTLKDQTVEISGLDTVAEAVGIINIPYPDVHIPFNDGLRIESGYGTHDQIDVSATQDGSIMVDLPTRSVDFSRASGSTVVNKSGELAAIGVDEPAISRDGLVVFGGATNIASWAVQLGNQFLPSDGSLVDFIATSPSGGLDASAFTTSAGGAAPRLQWNLDGDTEIDATYTFSIHLKKGTDDYVAIVFGSSDDWSPATVTYINLDNLEVTGTGSGQTKVTRQDNGWFRVAGTITKSSVKTGSYVRLYFLDNNAGLSRLDTSGGIVTYLYGVQFESGVVVSPLIITEGTQASRSPDIVDIPARNNLPPPGKPFTIALDIDCTLPADKTRYFFSCVGSGPTVRVYRSAGAIRFSMTDAAGNIVTPTYAISAKVRAACRFDGNTAALFLDGVKVSSLSCVGSSYTVDGLIYIGSSNGASYHADGAIKNLRIVHAALSDEQIAALGGPQ